MKTLSLNKQERQLVKRALRENGNESINRIALYMNSEGILAGFLKGGDGVLLAVPDDAPIRAEDAVDKNEEVRPHALFYKGKCALTPPSWYDCNFNDEIDMGKAFSSALKNWIQSCLLNPENGLSADKPTFVCVNCPERNPWQRDVDALRAKLKQIFAEFFPQVHVVICGLWQTLPALNKKNKRILVHIDGEWSEFVVVDPSGKVEERRCVHLGFRPGQDPKKALTLRINEPESKSFLFWEERSYENWAAAFADMCAGIQGDAPWKIEEAVLVCPDRVYSCVRSALDKSGMIKGIPLRVKTVRLPGFLLESLNAALSEYAAEDAAEEPEHKDIKPEKTEKKDGEKQKTAPVFDPTPAPQNASAPKPTSKPVSKPNPEFESIPDIKPARKSTWSNGEPDDPFNW